MNQKLQVKCTLLKTYLLKIEIWFDVICSYFKKYPVRIAVIFFVLLFITYLCNPDLEKFGLLVAAFGSVFVALKYSLDQANYHKSLFEERFAIFLKTDQILSAVFRDQDKDAKAYP